MSLYNQCCRLIESLVLSLQKNGGKCWDTFFTSQSQRMRLIFSAPLFTFLSISRSLSSSSSISPPLSLSHPLSPSLPHSFSLSSSISHPLPLSLPLSLSFRLLNIPSLLLSFSFLQPSLHFSPSLFAALSCVYFFI